MTQLLWFLDPDGCGAGGPARDPRHFQRPEGGLKADGRASPAFCPCGVRSSEEATRRAAAPFVLQGRAVVDVVWLQESSPLPHFHAHVIQVEARGPCQLGVG